MEAVLESHCVGWSSHVCQTYHRTAWQDLPVSRTYWSTFANSGGDEEFLRAEDMNQIGNPAVKSFNKADNLNYVVLENPGDEICQSLMFVHPGQAGFDVSLTSRSLSIDNKVDVSIHPQGSQPTYLPFQTNLTTDWAWTHKGVAFQEIVEGPSEICLRFIEPFRVDAILVRKQ